MVRMWLDDWRAAPDGWTWVKTVEEAKALLEAGVEEASLDHDLGACEACMNGLTPEEWFVSAACQAYPNCTHVGTGTDLCNWMAESGIWPRLRPMIHSANPVGGARMRGIIDRYFRSRDDEAGR